MQGWWEGSRSRSSEHKGAGRSEHLQGILFPKLEPQKEKAFSKGNQTQAGIKIAGRNINNLRYADATTLMTESEEDLKWPRVKKLA